MLEALLGAILILGAFLLWRSLVRQLRAIRARAPARKGPVPAEEISRQDPRATHEPVRAEEVGIRVPEEIPASGGEKEKRTTSDSIRAPEEIPASSPAPSSPALVERPEKPWIRRAGEHRGSLWISRALPPELERARLHRELRELADRRRRAQRRRLLAGAIAMGALALVLLIPSVRSALRLSLVWMGMRLGLIAPPPPPEPAPLPRDLEVSYSNQVEQKQGRLIFRGTVRNISQKTFDSLYAELSLIRRESQLMETRIVPIRPSRLGPGEQGVYELVVSASEFTGNRRVRIFAAGAEVPYRYVLPESSARNP